MKDLLSGTWTLDEQRQWRFLCIKTVIFSHGNVLFEGDWSERLDDRKVRSGSYSYDSDDNDLMIQYVEFDENGQIRTFHTDCYRIEAVDCVERRLKCLLASASESVTV